MFYYDFIRQLIWSAENVDESHFAVWVLYHDSVLVYRIVPSGQQIGFMMEVFLGKKVVSAFPLPTFDWHVLLLKVLYYLPWMQVW